MYYCLTGACWATAFLSSVASQLAAFSIIILLAICRHSGCTLLSGIVGVVIIVGVIGVCNRSQMKTSKCTCLIFGVSIDLDPG